MPIALLRLFNHPHANARPRVIAIRLLTLLACIAASTAAHAQSNQALRFNGVEAWLDLGSRSSFNFSSGFTLEAWIRPMSFGDTVGIVGNYRRDVVGGSGHGLVLDAAGRLGFILAHDIRETDYVWSPTPVALDEWTHVAGVWDGYMMRLYVDGAEVATSRVGSAALWTIDNSMAAARFLDEEDGYFDGYIDEIRLWNVARGTTDLLYKKHLRLQTAAPGLVSYLRLDDGSGQTAIDDADAGRVATLRGSSAWETSDVLVGVGRTAQTSPSSPMRAHYFNGTDVMVDYGYATRARPLMITSLLAHPGAVAPDGVMSIAPRSWMVVPAGDTFSVNMTFYLGRGAIGVQDAAAIENLRLFYQPSNKRNKWIPASQALAVDANAGTVTFGPIVAGPNGIARSGGRFIIGSTGDSRFESPSELGFARDLQDIRMCANQTARIALLADGRNLGYTWRKDGREIAGAVGPELYSGLLRAEHDGVYQVTVTDQSGESISTHSARVQAVIAPHIIGDPTDVRMTEGQPLTLFAEIEGTDMTYQWQRNRVDIPGANSQELVFASLDTNDAGLYRLMVKNECGEDNTVDVRVSVRLKPVPLGVDDEHVARTSVTASPNPSHGYVNVVATGVGERDRVVAFELVDQTGTVVASSVPQFMNDGTARATFDVSSIQSGMFICRVLHANASATSTPIVVRK